MFVKYTNTEQDSPAIKSAHLTEAAVGPEDGEKLLLRTIPEDPGSEVFTPDVGSTDGTEP